MPSSSSDLTGGTGGKIPFRWYWLLDTWALVAIVGGIFILLCLLWPGDSYLHVIPEIAIVVAINYAIIFRRKLYRRLGSNRLNCPRWLKLSWQGLVIAELLAFVIMVVRKIAQM